jgi:hypothetical protein
MRVMVEHPSYTVGARQEVEAARVASNGERRTVNAEQR